MCVTRLMARAHPAPRAAALRTTQMGVHQRFMFKHETGVAAAQYHHMAMTPKKNRYFAQTFKALPI